jgi:hypothetical protein
VRQPLCLSNGFCRSDLPARVFIRDTKLRALVAEFADSKQPQSPSRELLARAKTHCLPLVSFLTWLGDEVKRRVPVFSRLLVAISKPSPITGLIQRPLATVPLLLNIVKEKDPLLPKRSLEALGILQDNCPVLLDILQSPVCGELQSFPLEMHPLIKALAQLADSTRSCKRRPCLSAITCLLCVYSPSAH